MSCDYKSAPSPVFLMFKYEISKFLKHLYMSVDLNAGKVERYAWYSKISVSHLCVLLVMKLIKLTEACNVVDFYNDTS